MVAAAASAAAAVAAAAVAAAAAAAPSPGSVLCYAMLDDIGNKSEETPKKQMQSSIGSPRHRIA